LTYRRRNSRASGTETILSRTTDNLYWLSRYTEPADFVARILETSPAAGVTPKALCKKVRAGVPLGCNAESGEVAARGPGDLSAESRAAFPGRWGDVCVRTVHIVRIVTIQ